MKAIALALITGCTATTEVRLAELADRRLHVGTTSWGPAHLFAELSFVNTGDDCPVLGGSFRATVDGAPVEVVMNDYIDESTWCLFSPLELRLQTPPAHDYSVLELRDDSLSIVAPLGDVFVQRSATIASTTLSPGEVVTVAKWAPATDLAELEPRVVIRQGNSAHLGTDLAIAGDTITFTSPMLERGDGLLEIYMNDGGGLPCTNARCTLAAMRDVVVPIVVE